MKFSQELISELKTVPSVLRGSIYSSTGDEIEKWWLVIAIVEDFVHCIGFNVAGEAISTTIFETCDLRDRAVVGCADPSLFFLETKKPVAWRFKPALEMPWSLSEDAYYISCQRNKGYIIEPLYA